MLELLDDVYKALAVISAGATVGILSYFKGRKKGYRQQDGKTEEGVCMKDMDTIYTRKEVFMLVTEHLEKEIQEMKVEFRETSKAIMATLNVILEKLNDKN